MGAKGQGDAGRSATEILTTYYSGTTVASTAIRPSIRIGLTQGVDKLTFRSAGAVPGTGNDGHIAFGWGSGRHEGVSGEAWEVHAEGGSGWGLYKNGSKTDTFSGQLHVDFGVFNSLLSIDQTGRRYRWGYIDLVHRSGAALFDAVLQMGSYNAYLYGLGEVPSSWNAAALQAQAIAARTYALEKANRAGDFRSGCACTVYSSTVDQAYIGYDKEAEGSGYGARWVAAVDNTSGKAVLNGGAPIQAYYSSSSGGHTENNEFVWGGSPLSYLAASATPGTPLPATPCTAGR